MKKVIFDAKGSIRGQLVFQRLICLSISVAIIIMGLSVSACKKKADATISIDSANLYQTQVETVLGENQLCSILLSGEDTSFVLSEEMNVDDYLKIESGMAILWHDSLHVGISELDESYQLVRTTTFEKEEEEIPVKLWIDDASGYTVLLEKSNIDAWSCSYYLATPQGESVPLAALDDAFLIDALRDASGNLCVLLSDRVILFDQNGQTIYESFFADDQYATAFALGSDDWIYVACNDDSGKVYICSLDQAKGTIIQSSEIRDCPMTSFSSLYGISSGLEDCIVMQSSDGIMEYNLVSGEMMTLCYFSDSEIAVSDGMPLVFDGNRSIYAFGSLALLSNDADTASGEYNLVHLTLSEASTNRETITLGILSQGESEIDIESIVRLFNRNSTEFEISIIYYADYSACNTDEDFDAEYERARGALELAFLSSDAPDVLYLYSDDMYNLEDSGMLLDLNQLAKEDRTFSEDEYVENIWRAGEEDGFRYWITPFVSINGLVSSTAVCESNCGMSLQEMADISEQTGTDIFAGETCSGYLYNLYLGIENEYVDKEGNTARFDSQSFVDMLTFIHDQGESETSVTNSDGSEKSLFYPFEVSDIGYYLSLCDISNLGLAYNGYPDTDTCNPLISAPAYFGISSSTQNQDGAWSFLSFMLSNTVQNASRSLGGECIPIKVSAFEQMISTGTENFANGSGSYIMTDTGSVGLPDLAVTDEILDQYRSIVYSAEAYQVIDWTIYDIVMEETEPYFEGDKTAAEVSAIIQNRVQTYLDEK